MSTKRKLLIFYCLILTFFINFSGIVLSLSSPETLIFQLIFLPVTLYFLYSVISIIFNNPPKSSGLWKLIIYYSFILSSIMTITGLASATSVPQLISAALFLPVTVYFLSLVIPKRNKALLIPQVATVKSKPRAKKAKETEDFISKEPPVRLKRDFDLDRRAFLKLAGSAGISLFLLSIFTKKAHAAFFGSVPGPGTVAIKDISGVQIDPAQHHPTDGYKIAQLDDATPSFYGFTNKGGAWFIMKEDSNAYRYTKGTSDFSANWTDRADLTYDYFDNIF